jgi:hypothetical protein
MICLRIKDGFYAPIVLCDYCNEAITDPHMALELTDHREWDPANEELIEVYHVHKDACDQAMQEKFAGQCGSTELSIHMFQLAYNVGLRPDDFEKWMNGVELVGK